MIAVAFLPVHPQLHPPALTVAAMVIPIRNMEALFGGPDGGILMGRHSKWIIECNETIMNTSDFWLISISTRQPPIQEGNIALESQKYFL
jgi:hypothetical protein